MREGKNDIKSFEKITFYQPSERKSLREEERVGKRERERNVEEGGREAERERCNSVFLFEKIFISLYLDGEGEGERMKKRKSTKGRNEKEGWGRGWM